MLPIAGMPGIGSILFILLAPTGIVLLLMSKFIAVSPTERLSNIASGSIRALAAVFATLVLEESFGFYANSWADRNYRLLCFAVAPVAAALGGAVAGLCRYEPRKTRAGNDE